MPSQYFTIAKIAGDAADAASDQLRRWHQARLVDGSSTWSPDQWPEQVRKEVDDFADNLREHAHQPPVLFYAEYVDLWSFSPHFSFPLKLAMGDRYELMYLELPISEQVSRQLRKLRRYGKTDEDRFFATIILAAAMAWEDLVQNGLLILLRRVVGGLVTDEEIKQSLKTIPDWLQPN